MSAPDHVEGQMPLLPPADPDPKPLAAVPDEVDKDADVTLICDECQEQVTGKAGGRNSASFQLGRHKRSAHGARKGGKVATPRRRGKGPSQPTAAELRHPGISAVADAAEEIGGKGTPSAANLAKGIGALLSTASGMAATWAVDSDPAISKARGSNVEQVKAQAVEMSAELVASLTITPASAERIIKPIARLIAPSGLNAKYGRVLVENTDLGPALAELVEIGRNWREFLAVRREHVEVMRAQLLAQAEAATPYVAPTPAAQEAAAAASPSGDGPSPMGRGVVAMPTVRSA